ncbi:Ubiquitin specific protease [Operophtera brumata]|uniref:Ubiquitin specific protease n=1 Tax=Operophtera brumata TaxID=104452 RepID=A0A0L7L5C6_OPEBR|nr:Ubiquitin specific protease [Operophtera brumata]
MGAKDSKPSFICYEDAVKRVSDSELRRIREAFKRCAGSNGTALSLEAFVHEVLCDGVPYEVAEWLYQGCGGTKRGIAFKDLLCGIVVLTKGNIEEKIKTLHLENTTLPVTGAQRSAEILLGLFGAGDKVTFDQFRSWLLIHRDATVLSKWLLSDLNVTHDLETPTFYQSLAGVTHLEERLDIESLTPLLSPPLPPAAVAGTFLAFDENRDGHVDFKELKELLDMVDILCTVANEHSKNQSSRASTPDEAEPEPERGFQPDAILMNLREKLVVAPKGRKPTESEGVIGHDTVLTLEDFLIWSVESADGLVSPFLALLFETCHVVLGLRPQCKHHERNIVNCNYLLQLKCGTIFWLKEYRKKQFKNGEQK